MVKKKAAGGYRRHPPVTLAIGGSHPWQSCIQYERETFQLEPPSDKEDIAA
ncbi:hypothetical protein DPMN_086098 [Dreissena polymorpha]|uniref:Uncharacterized protein n=1 Tax=Dreissena polymorpha TaxID=45954 RepID=A0A9D3YEX2_DREPO|nr:hypothetical protein DPMN_086098 [Dreissena polymorpha]